MPKLSKIGSNRLTGHFGFSRTRPEDLASTRQTIVNIEVDKSGSVVNFKDLLEKSLEQMVEACRKSPESDSLVLRTSTFNHIVSEAHGYEPVNGIDLGRYRGLLGIPDGSTSLYEATLSGAKSLALYGKELYDADYKVNGVLVVITDGDDTSSPQDAARALAEAKAQMVAIRRHEHLDSVLAILVGVNMSDAMMQHRLATFEKELPFDQFIAIEKADAAALAKLGKFLSSSFREASKSLAHGQKSQPLTF